MKPSALAATQIAVTPEQTALPVPVEDGRCVYITIVKKCANGRFAYEMVT
jgi:hypothetical protein